MKTNIECPKCAGAGHISAFSHYANGVCFCCNGTKVVAVDLDEKKAELSEDTIKRAEWIINSTSASYTKLGYNTLLRIRNFAHGGFGLQQAYPNLLSCYREHGEQSFQASQEVKLAELHN